MTNDASTSTATAGPIRFAPFDEQSEGTRMTPKTDQQRSRKIPRRASLMLLSLVALAQVSWLGFLGYAAWRIGAHLM